MPIYNDERHSRERDQQQIRSILIILFMTLATVLVLFLLNK